MDDFLHACVHSAIVTCSYDINCSIFSSVCVRGQKYMYAVSGVKFQMCFKLTGFVM